MLVSHAFFCSIINRSLNAAIVFNSNSFLVIMDKYPITKGHVLVIPKNHYDNLLDMNQEEVGKTIFTCKSNI